MRLSFLFNLHIVAVSVSDDDSCTYTFDPESDTRDGCESKLEEGELSDSGVWECPHQSIESSQLCAFHTQPEDLPDNTHIEISLWDELDEASGGDGSSSFIGAKIRSLELDSIHQNQDVSTIDFRHATFLGEVSIEESRLESSLDFRGAEFRTGVSFDGSTLQGVRFSESLISGTIDFTSTTLQDDIEIFESNFKSGVDFKLATFESGFRMTKCSVNGKITFPRTFKGAASFHFNTFDSDVVVAYTEFRNFLHFIGNDVRGNALFESSKFRDSAAFNRSTFHSGSLFRSCDFEKKADYSKTNFLAATFFEDVTFEDTADFKSETAADDFFPSAIFGGATYFSDVDFQDQADFRTVYNPEKEDIEATTKIANFHGTTIFEDCDFSEGAKFTKLTRVEGAETAISFQGCRLPRANFEEARLQSATLERAELEKANFEDAILIGADMERVDLSKSDLFGAMLFGTKLYGAILSDIKINDDTLFGHHYKDDYKKGSWVNRQIELVSNKNSLPAQSRGAYIRRKEQRRQQYRANSDHLKWVRSTVSRYTWKHGEGLKNILYTSAGTILGFAALYPLSGGVRVSPKPPISHAINLGIPKLGPFPDTVVTAGNSLYFSTVTFTTLGFGDIQPGTGMGQLLAGAEALIGAILVAAFLFVLGRRTTR